MSHKREISSKGGGDKALAKEVGLVSLSPAGTSALELLSHF